MIEFRQTSISINALSIVKDISFTAKSGRVTVLLGQNGSGKSTLLSALCHQRRYQGKILIEGEEIGTFSPARRAQKLALLPQILPDTDMSVAQLCEMGRNPYVGVWGRLKDDDRRAIGEALRRVRMEEMSARQVNSLSGGERQRAFVAMMLAQESRWLVMDEPTTFLDVGARREILQLCRQLAREGKGILIVLHDLNEAMQIADDVVILEQGRVHFAGSRDQCLQNEVIEHHFNLRRCQDGENVFFI